MSSPLFSIILPTYRVETVIGECLESLLRQTCTDYEILVMDGGSNDKTLELVSKQAAAFDGRLILRSGKDTGVYDAMNQGVSLARGEWLYFLGADDRLHDPQVLEKVAQFFHLHPDRQLVYGDVIMRSDSRRYDGGFDLNKLLLQGNICHQAVFYRRTVFDKIGLYNLRYRIWADWDLNIRCFQRPELLHKHLDLVVADYNDTGGVSTAEDPEFRKCLPCFNRKDGRLKHRLRRQAAALWGKLARF